MHRLISIALCWNLQHAMLLEQSRQIMSLYQNKIAVCAAEGDFRRSPNPAVPNLWQLSFFITFNFSSSSWTLISCPSISSHPFFAGQHKGWAGMARTYVLWLLPAPCPHLLKVHFPPGPQHSGPQCRSTKPQPFPQASARIFSFWVLSSNRDFTTPIWQRKAFSTAFQLSLLHLKSIASCPLYGRHREQFTPFSFCSRLSGVLYIEQPSLCKPSFW